MSKKKLDNFDIDKLAYSIAMAETGDCQKGSGKYNNCFGIIRNGKFVRYETKQESYEDFKNLWIKYYGGYPTRAMAKKYTGGDRVDNWIRIVGFYYNEV